MHALCSVVLLHVHPFHGLFDRDEVVHLLLPGAGAVRRTAGGRHRGRHGAGLVLVSPGEDEEHGEVGDAEHGQHPVEEVQPPAVQVVPDPRAPRGAVDGEDEEAAEEEPHGERHQEEARAHGLHPLGRLADEELQLPHVRERLPGAHQEELRHEPERADGDVALSDGRFAALPLDESRDGHGGDGEDEPGAHALQRGEPLRAAREAGGQRHQEALVEGGEEQDGDEEEHGEGPRRDGEPGAGARAEAAVHARGLLHGEGGHLGVDRPEEDARGPDGQQLHHHLHLLHLRHRRRHRRCRRPLLRRRGGQVRLHDRRLVKAPASSTHGTKTDQLPIEHVHTRHHTRTHT
jgi:hypothetical protein